MFSESVNFHRIFIRKSQTASTPAEEPVQFVITEVRERKHKCQICGKTYFRACHLSDHMIYGHSTELKHKCPQCPKAFPHKRNLSMHISNVHDGGMYQCTLCEKTFTSDPYLRRHLRAHSAEKKHVCEICDKRFLQPANLREHMLVHTKIREKKSKLKDFHCSYCPKTYKSKKSFRKHQERHGNEVAEEVPQDDQEVPEEKQEMLEEDIKDEDITAGEGEEAPEEIKQEPHETEEMDLANMKDYII